MDTLADPVERALLAALAAKHFSALPSAELKAAAVGLLVLPVLDALRHYDGSLVAQVALKDLTSEFRLPGSRRPGDCPDRRTSGALAHSAAWLRGPVRPSGQMPCTLTATATCARYHVSGASTDARGLFAPDGDQLHLSPRFFPH